MYRNLSIKSKLIIGILVSCLFPFLIGSLNLQKNTEAWLYEKKMEESQLLLSQTAHHIDVTIPENMENLTNLMVQVPELAIEDAGITSYMDFGSASFRKKTSSREDIILDFFHSIKESHDLISLVSYGTADGGYVAYPEFQPTEPYDPRIRDWYITAAATEGAIISEPYVTKMTEELVISISRRVASRGKTVGVASITVKLGELSSEMKKIETGESSEAFILSPENVFISSSKNSDWLLNSAESLGLSQFTNLEEHDGDSFEVSVNGVQKVFSVVVSEHSGWKYVSSINKEELLQQSRSISELLLSVYLITLLIMLLLTILIAGYITRPILKITQVINKMATFHFDSQIHKDLEKYTTQKDEIGEISRALTGMQDNLIELKNKVAKIDEDIQNINIHDKTIDQLRLSKDNPFAGIIDSINGLLKKVNNYIQEINSQKEQIHYLADYDALTNLPNRRSFREKLDLVLCENHQGAVLLLDMDNFKGINDSLGHMFGDKVLQHVSFKLRLLRSEHVFVSRFGGDEFLILHENIQHREELSGFLESLFALFSKPFFIDEYEITVEFSVGISLFPEDSLDLDQIIMNADLALYHIKSTGKKNHAFYNESMKQVLKQKMDIKFLLNEAIVQDGFKMVYQPVVDIRSGEIVGYEALIRLKKSVLSPSEFIPVSEETGLILPIGRIAARIVVKQLHDWKCKGFQPKPISINFSSAQIHDSTYNAFLFDLLDLYDVSPELIIIEITENILLENKEATIQILSELRSHGIKISVDDFGTGYSSFSYLTFLPIDTIKFDKTLSNKFLELDNIAVMNSLISLSHSLKLKVVAEGIEDQSQVKHLILGDCDMIQGFYFSKPLEAEEVEATDEKKFPLNFFS